MRVRAANIRFHIEVLSDSGSPPGSRPTLLALHGGPGLDHTALRPGIDSLREHFEVVLVDQRGHGRTDRSSPEHWNLDRWADDVAALCEVLDAEHPIVLGVSFGANVALRFAQRHPERPAGIVSVSGSARRDRAASIEIFRRVGGDEVARAAERHYTAPTPETGAEYARLCMPFYFTSPAVLGNPGGIRNVELMYHWLQGEDQTFDLRPDLPAIRCPVLVMSGDSDPVCPVHLAREILDGLTAPAQLSVIDNSGHGIFRDKPEEFAEVVNEWASRFVTPTNVDPS